MRFLHLTLPFLAVALAFCAASRSAGETPELLTPPGWTIGSLLRDGGLVELGGKFAASNDCIATYASDGEIILLDPADGAIKQRLQGDKVDPWADELLLHIEGGQLFVLSREFRYWTTQDEMTLSVFDLATGQWRGKVTALIGSNLFSQAFWLNVGVSGEEIRVVAKAGEVLRWNNADLSPLPTLQVVGPTTHDPMRASIATTLGDEFCVGLSSSANELILEKNGIFRLLPISKATVYADFVAKSGKYLVLSDNEGLFVFNKSAAKPVSSFISLPAGIAADTYSIGMDRYFSGIRNEKEINILDLGNPSAVPMVIPLPPGTIGRGNKQGIGSGNYWAIYSRGGIGTQFLRFPLFPAKNFVAVNVADARAKESDGVIKFAVTVDRPITEPVTVQLQTRPGSAGEGTDYVKWTGSVTLTPDKPSATVSVKVLPDRQLETYESFIMEISSVTGAWRTRSHAFGVIASLAFPRMPVLPPPPGKKLQSPFSDEWVMTSAGVVAMGHISSTESCYYVADHGSTDWRRLTAMGTHSWVDSYSAASSIVDVKDGRLCLAVKRQTAEPSGERLFDLITVDVATDQVVATTPSARAMAILHRDGLVCAVADTGNLGFYPFGATEPTWQIPYEWGVRRFSEEEFVFLEGGQFSVGGAFIRVSFANGTTVGKMPQWLSEVRRVSVHGAGDQWVAHVGLPNQDDLLYVRNLGTTGFPCYPLAMASYFNRSPAVADNGMVFVPGKSVSVNVMDGKTGALLTVLPQYSLYSLAPSAWAGGVMAYVDAVTPSLIRLQTQLALPEITVKSFVLQETGGGQTLQFKFSEAADFPITVRLAGSTPDLDVPGASVTVPAGTTVIPFPVSVIDDILPELEETLALSLEVSGNGAIKNHRIKLSIPANDFAVLNEEPKSNVAFGSSVASHSSGVLVGFAAKRLAVEARYQTLLAPQDPKSAGSFGHSVACNRNYSVVGAPFLRGLPFYPPGDRASSVSVYGRKSGKLIQKFTRNSTKSLFGTVVRLDGDRLFVGAPGKQAYGTVSAYTIGKETELTIKEPGSQDVKNGFGRAITSCGTYLFVGSPGNGGGRVYQFSAGSGRLIRTFQPPPGGYRNFGQSLEAAGSLLVVGAPALNGKAAVFIFNMNTGMLVDRIPDPFSEGANFGASLTWLSKRVLAIGCPSSTFSPAGGIFIYDLNGKNPEFVTFVEPPRARNNQQFRGLGMVAGLSAVDGILSISTGPLNDPLDVTESRVELDPKTKFTVAVLDFSKFLPVASDSPTRLAAALPDNAWERALGRGATETDCRLEVRRENAGLAVQLPDIASLAVGTSLHLEKSIDLREWTSIASFAGDGAAGWKLSSGERVADEDLSVPVSTDQDRVYFRIRCEAP